MFQIEKMSKEQLKRFLNEYVNRYNNSTVMRISSVTLQDLEKPDLINTCLFLNDLLSVRQDLMEHNVHQIIEELNNDTTETKTETIRKEN